MLRAEAPHFGEKRGFGMWSFSGWSLKTKFALCTGLLIGASSMGFTSWTLSQVEKEERTSVYDAQRALVRATVADLDEKIELRRDAILTIAPLLSKAAPQTGAERDAFFEPRPVLRKMFDSVHIVDLTGRALFSLPHESLFPDAGASYRSYLKALLGGAPMVISSPYRSAEGGEPFLLFGSPLHASDGTIVGALLCVLNLDHSNFLGHLAEIRIGEEGYFVLIERSDHPLFVMDRFMDRISEAAPGGADNPIMAAALQGHEGAVEGVNSQGIDTLRTFAPLNSVPWLLVAVYPTSEAFVGLRERRREVIWVGVFLFVCASVMGWVMTLWLLRPLTRMHDHMVDDSSGAGIRWELSEYGSAELLALGNAYNNQSQRRKDVEDRLKASERRLQRITDNMPALIAHMDEQGRYTFANAQYGRIFGEDPQSMLGRTFPEIRGERGDSPDASWMDQALLGETARFERTDLIDGQVRYSQCEYIPDFDNDGKVIGVYTLEFDITAIKAAQALQAAGEERLRAITDNLPVLIAYVGKDHRIQFVNATFHIWYGMPAADAIGRTFAELAGAKRYAVIHEDRITRCLKGERVAFEIETRTLVGIKILHSIYIPDLKSDGSIPGFYILCSDVTDLKNAQRQLDLLVRSDNLTGLPNRFQFNETLPEAIERSQRTGLGLAVMFLDVDHFKRINDVYGHAAGDAVLKEFALRLKEALRSTDAVARLAGDEFVVVLEGLHRDDEASAVALKILSGIARPFHVGDQTIEVTTSVGVVYQSVATASASDLLAKADAALYQAKTAGRNCFQLFNLEGVSPGRGC
jgi:diguanylate cyclase (GGDEF)-like protein/PAS domain S-box-containing protein